jgi:hypothetical protein
LKKLGLLAPYEATIVEEQWEQYLDERSNLQMTNTPGMLEHKRIKKEGLMPNIDRMYSDVG